MAVYTILANRGKSIKTRFGSFKIGALVKLTDEAKQNDSYEHYFDSELIIDWVDTKDLGLGEVEPIFSFSLKDGGTFPFSLYGYEIEVINKP